MLPFSFTALLLIAITTFFPQSSVAKENENNTTHETSNIFGVQVDKNGYFSVPKEGKNNIDEQKQNKLIEIYKKQEQDFIRQQEQKFKKGY